MIYQIKHRDCTLNAEVIGGGAPVFMIHGVASDHAYFHNAALILAENHTVVTYDRCGYSDSKICREHEDQSSGMAPDHSLNRQTEDAAYIINELGLGRVTVFGHSAGCLVAMELALRYPELVSSLIMYEPPLAVSQEGMGAISAWNRQLSDASAEGKIAKTFLIFTKVIGGIDPEGRPDDLMQQARNFANMKVFLKYEMDEFLSYTFKPLPFDKIKVPVVLGWGTLGCDGIFQKEGPLLSEKYGLRGLAVSGYHNFPKERPEAFAAWLEKQLL